MANWISRELVWVLVTTPKLASPGSYRRGQRPELEVGSFMPGEALENGEIPVAHSRCAYRIPVKVAIGVRGGKAYAAGSSQPCVLSWPGNFPSCPTRFGRWIGLAAPSLA
jgi:hypothetical protein